MIRERCVAVRSAERRGGRHRRGGAPRATGAPEEAADVVGGVGGHASLSKVRASRRARCDLVRGRGGGR